jgi:uncharacterized protein YbjT (DUF2867 family)
MKNYVITGASGKTGKLVAKELLLKGAKVKAIGRKAENLKDLEVLGAELLIGNVNDREFVAKAFAGADAVYCLISPDLYSDNVLAEYKKQADNYLNAVKANNVKNVILLSSLGANLRNGAGIVDGLGYMEEIFLQLKDTNVLNLRPTYFMENTFGLIGTIKQMGIAGTPLNGDVRFPIVATKDIAVVAAKYMLELSFKGNVTEYVLGAKDITYSEITQIVGKAIGMPDLKYVQFPYESAIQGMVDSGFCSKDVATQFAGLAKGFNEGTIKSTQPRNHSNTTPTTYNDFAETFAMAYQHS